jgi:tetratricopeptide (TPR) repeat protein
MGAGMYQRNRVLLALAISSALGVLFLSSPVRMLAQQPAADQPQFQNEAEYNLYTAITQDTNPQTRLEKLQQWEKQFPNTAWIKARRTLYLTTYVALSKPKEAVEAAKTILANDPKDFSALYYIMFYTQTLSQGNPEILDQGEKAASFLLANIGTPPPNVKDEDWAKLRPDVELMARVNLGFIAFQRKNWPGAETELLKSLQMKPNNGLADFWLGYAMGYQKKFPAAIFYWARAGTYEGDGAAVPEVRKQALDLAAKQYKSYHGSNEGFNDVVLARVKSDAILPADFKIKTAQEIIDERAAAQAKLDAQNPELALWKQLKGALTSPEGAGYFGDKMKDTLVPTLKGKVVSIQPALKPKTIVLALEDGTTPDATLKFETPLPGKVEPGTELSFEGVPQSYAAAPFMVVFNVDKDKLHGWTGKNTPTAPVHHKTLTSKR